MSKFIQDCIRDGFHHNSGRSNIDPRITYCRETLLCNMLLYTSFPKIFFNSLSNRITYPIRYVIVNNCPPRVHIIIYGVASVFDKIRFRLFRREFVRNVILDSLYLRAFTLCEKFWFVRNWIRLLFSSGTRGVLKRGGGDSGPLPLLKFQRLNFFYVIQIKFNKTLNKIVFIL